MLNIILFGPPGAGKGTQAVRLIENYNLVHVSTGDIFRANINEGTELGNLAKTFMDAGQLVPDDVTIKMLEAEVQKHPGSEGFIFDGFPRTVAQSKALDEMLSKMGESITLLLSLQVERDELIKRLLHRGESSGRSDDKDENVIKKRIDVYNKETTPVMEYYSRQNKHVSINGIGEVEEITGRLCKAINTCKVEK
jgi:adenylate kinase